MGTLAIYILETLLGNWVSLALAFTAGFMFRTSKTVSLIAAGLLAMALIGNSMADNPDHVRLTESFVVSFFGLLVGFFADHLRKRKAKQSG